MKNALLGLGFYLAISVAAAADLNARVFDKSGKPVADAVVLASMETTVTTSKDLIRPNRPAEIVQLDKEFLPYVTVIPIGTLVNFPNKDTVKHHVYSFSAPKKFDLPLYSGSSAPPIRFDKAGIVVIGCNIHDWMIGYIYVAETPYFAQTGAEGKATLKDLPVGKYTLRAWHPDATGSEEQTKRSVEVNGNGDAELAWQLDIKPRVNPRHTSTQDMNSY